MLCSAMQGGGGAELASRPPTLPPGPYQMGRRAASHSSLLSEEGGGEDQEAATGTSRLLRALDAALQSGLYLWQVRYLSVSDLSRAFLLHGLGP